ncbi:serine/threonine protein kinase [Tahibacter aquaticus]|uniref:non-specific serine/threonine protein kinase n=1 Tax=Tahibacter aquaticus TaxID=520092 RepID=A0A4R6Z4W7_9GAMM|nr:serine/threonine-protein kinase [Tahibacter aquaticus]TDR46674.1 serine/threonine protein kinase [Tahibacter aquaticus]
MAQTPVKIPGYEFLRPLGAGGMSTVWLAVQESLQRKIAIKLMKRTHDSASDDARQFEKRFLLEGRTMAKLPHRNIVAVYDIVSTDDVAYIAMEFLEGGTLSDRMQAGLSLADAVSVVVQIAGALDFAHSQGIVHRDLKPANIMFRDAATPVLTDFGIARQQDQSATRLTQTGMLVGTPNYMSPEQISGSDIDGRSDLYSLGIMFYELLSGRTPFNGDTPIAVMMAHLTQPAPPLDADFAYFQPVLDRMLAKNRDDRFATLHEFVAALKQRVVASDTLLMRLQLSPGMTASEQLRQLGFTASDPSGSGLRNMGALASSAPLPRPQDVAARKTGGVPPPAPRPPSATNVQRPPPRKPASATVPPPSRKAPPASPPWLWIGVAVFVALALGSVGIWRWKAASGMSAEERQLIGYWVKDAERLAGESKLVSPPGENAYEVLQKVLQKDPENESAQALLDRIAQAMRSEAEAALAKGDFVLAQDKVDQSLFVRRDDATTTALKQRIVEAAAASERRKQIEQLLAGAAAADKAARPFGPDGSYALLLRARELAPDDAAIKQRVDDFIAAQLAPARAALAAKDTERANLMLIGLRPELGKEPAFVSLADSASQAQRQAGLEKQLLALLQRGEGELKAGRLAEPAAANAFASLGQLRELAPQDARVDAFATQLAAALVADGRQSAAGAPQRALERAELALRVAPQRADATALKNEIEQRLGQRLADIGRALSQAKQAIAEQRYFAPADNNARSALDKVFALDAQNAEARQLQAELPLRVAETIQARAAAKDSAAALALAREGTTVFPADARLKTLLAQVEAQAQTEQREADAKSARERIATAIAATPLKLDALAQAATALNGLLAANPRDADALALRARLAETLAAAQRAAPGLVEFDALAAFVRGNEKLLAAEPAAAALTRDAAALRQNLEQVEQARLAALQGELQLNAQPWANVESVVDGNRKAVSLPADASTPFTLKLPAGSYVITFRHPQANKPVTVIAKVEAQRRAAANAAFPTISAEDYFSRAGW